MSKLRTRFALAAGACALGMTIAPAASANDISGKLPSAGAYSYSDSTNRFCVTVSPNPHRHITAKVTAVSGNGPSFTVSARSGQSTRTQCKSLMYAYENSHYTVTVTGSASGSKKHQFWT